VLFDVADNHTSIAVWWSRQQRHWKGENVLSCLLRRAPDTEAAACVAADVGMTAGKVFLAYTDGGW